MPYKHGAPPALRPPKSDAKQIPALDGDSGTAGWQPALPRLGRPLPL